MTVSRYGKELAEMMTLWNCGEREAAQQFLQAYYILKGNRPEAAAECVNSWQNDVLFGSFIRVMDDLRKPPKNTDLLPPDPVEP